MADIVLKVENLVKNYGNVTAVNDISFEIPRGKIIGFLGPNGAGKTTTIQILIGVTLATSGKISYFGRDFFQHKQYCLQKINFASAFNTLLGRLSVWENLVVFGELYKIPRPAEKIRQLLEDFEIPELANTQYYDLSTGQKTRVNLVKSLLNDPELILLDEPTASLDPDIADKTLTFIEKLRRKHQVSMLYTSHDMEEVTRICDEVIILQKGKIVAKDSPSQLTKLIPQVQIRITFADQKTKIIDTEEKFIPQEIFKHAKSTKEIINIEIRRPTLEDVFLQFARNDHVHSKN